MSRYSKSVFCIFIFFVCFVLCWSQEPCNFLQSKTPEVKLKETPFLDGWINLSRSFVHVVAPSNLPTDLIAHVVKNQNSSKFTGLFDNGQFIKDILKIEAGFASCLILGLLFVVVMLFGWTCFLCCRSCGNCGGNKNQRQTKTITSRRRIYIMCTIGVLGFLIVAETSAFLANWEMKQVLLNGNDTVQQTINDVDIFFNDIYWQIKDFGGDCMGQKFDELKSVTDILLDENMKDLGNDIKMEVERSSMQVKEEVNKAEETFEPLRILKDEVDLVKVKETNVGDLIGKIKQMKTECKNLNNKNCDTINTLNVNDFKKKEESSYDQIPSEVKTILRQLQKKNFSQILENEYEKIPGLVVTKTKDTRNEIIADIEKFVKDKDKYIDNFNKDVLKEIDPIKKDIDTNVQYTRNDVDKFFAKTPDFEPFVYWGVFGGILLVAVPTVVLVLGLCCGICGHSEGKYPSERNCLSNCGGCTLMASVYMMFIFSSIAMMVTVVTFQAGGHVEAYGCRLLYNDLTEFDEVYDRFVTNVKLPTFLQDVRISDLISKCKDNSPIYEVLPYLQTVIGNISTKSDKADEYIENMGKMINETVTELCSNLEKDLAIIKIDDSHINELKAFLKSKNEPIIGLKNVKEQIETFKQLRGTDIPESVKQLLNDTISLLQSVDEASVTRNEIQSLERKLDSITKKLSTIFDDLKTQISKTEPVVIEKVSTVAHTYFQKLLYGFDIGEVIMKEIGRCGSLYSAFIRGRHFMCNDVLGPVNALWFSLGTCCFFFLFAIPFATKLSKHYYRMDEDENTYVGMDNMRTSQPIIMPNLPKNKVYPMNDDSHHRNDYDEMPIREPRRQGGIYQREPPRFYSDNGPPLYAYDETQTSIPRSRVGNQEREPPRYYQERPPVHQNHAYEPDIDSRWNKY